MLNKNGDFMQVKNITNNYKTQNFGLKFTTQSYNNVPSSIVSIMKKLEKQESTNNFIANINQKKNKYFLSILHNASFDNTKDKSKRTNNCFPFSNESWESLSNILKNDFFGHMEKKIKGESKLFSYFTEIMQDDKKLLSEIEKFKQVLIVKKYYKSVVNSIGQNSKGGGDLIIFM